MHLVNRISKTYIFTRIVDLKVFPSIFQSCRAFDEDKETESILSEVLKTLKEDTLTNEYYCLKRLAVL